MNIVDSALSFEELKDGLNMKITDLKILNQIRGGWGKDTVDDIYMYTEDLRDMFRTVIDFKTILQNGRSEIDELKKTIIQLDSLSERLSYMKNNLPAHIPNCQINSADEEEKLNANAPISKFKEKATEKSKATNQQSLKQGDDVKVAKPLKSIPKIDFITLEEFEAIPKYTKGRISYEKINDSIGYLNKAVEGKYTLIRKPRAKLTPIEHSMVTEYKKQINQECKGLYFITDDDIKKHGGMKLDTCARNILTILRTLKRLKEIRGPGNLLRYCVM